MADFTQSGGSSGGTYAKYYTGKLSVWENSYDIASNSSNVGYRLQLISGNSGRFGDLKASYSVTIDGVCRNSGSGSYSLGHNGTITLCEGNFTVWHNDDGKKSVWCSAVIDFQSHSASPGDFYPSGNLNLSTIPRYTTVYNSLRSKTINTLDINWSTTNAIDWVQYSLNGGGWTDIYGNPDGAYRNGHYQITGLNPNTNYTIKTRCKRTDSQLWSEAGKFNVTTYDIAKLTSIPNVNIGSAHNIKWTNPSGASTSLKLCKTDNSTIIDYGAVTGTSKSITPTASKIYSLTPNSNTYKARYIITTTANGKSYTNSKDFTFTVTNSNPTFSNFTYQDTNTTITALTGNNQILVNGYSNVKATVSTANKATAKNSATMKTYKLAVGNKNVSANYNASANVNLSINSINNNVLDLYAIDSRGNSTKVRKTATIKNYSNIKIKALSVTRQNNVGTVTTLKFEGEFWNASFGSVTNAITNCKYKYKTTSSSTWADGKTTLTYTISGNKITGSLNVQGDKGTDGFSADNSYNIQLILSDKLSTATYNVILSSGNPALAIYKNNVAIGQQYDTSEGSKLQVNGNTSVAGYGKYKNGIYSRNSGEVGTPIGNGKLVIKRANNSEAPNNGVVLEFGNTKTYAGQLYIGDNATQGIYYNGWSDGKRGTWKRLADVPVTLYNNSSGTTGTITLSETAANFNYLEIFYCDNNSKEHRSIKISNPNGKTITLDTIEPYDADKNMYIRTTSYAINNTSITVKTYIYMNFWKVSGSDNCGVNVEKSNYIKIIKVIGYK